MDSATTPKPWRCDRQQRRRRDRAVAQGRFPHLGFNTDTPGSTCAVTGGQLPRIRGSVGRQYAPDENDATDMDQPAARLRAHSVVAA